jgi:hypothetical protein
VSEHSHERHAVRPAAECIHAVPGFAPG